MEKKTINALFILLIWIVAAFVVGFSIRHVIGSDSDLFNLCDTIMYGVAHTLNISYEETCVYGNQWFIPGIAALSTLVLPLYTIYHKKTILSILFSMWCLVIIYGYYMYFWAPYIGNSVIEVFHNSVSNILSSFGNTQTEYKQGNILVYVFIPSITVYFNLLLFLETKNYINN